MSASIVFNQVAIMFIIIIIGYICKKLDYVNREVIKGMNEILLNIAIPAMVLSSFNQEIASSALSGGLIVFVFALITHTVSVILGSILFKKYPNRQKVVMQFILVFSNCAFMGYPIMGGIFGSIGVFYTSLYVVVFNLFLWSYGIMLFTGARDFKTIKKALLNPGTIATLLGLILLLTPFKLPSIVAGVATLVGGLTTPLAMIVIGAMLAEVKISELFSGLNIYYATLLRLVILPMLSYFALLPFVNDPMVLATCVLMTAMPAASNTVIFSGKFDGDSILASKIVVLSTGLSMITIPMIFIWVS